MGLRQTVRSLLKAPMFTVVALITLAAGIGSNTALWVFIDAILIRPLPYPHADRLVRCTTVGIKSGQAYGSSFPDFLDWRQRSTSFEKLAATRSLTFNLVGLAGPEVLSGEIVSQDFFEVLGAIPSAGRTLRDSGHEQAVVLSHGLFERLLRPKAITLDGDSYAVVGVMPPSFAFHNETELWMSAASDRPDNREEAGSRGTRRFAVYGRLKAGVSLQHAQSEMDAIAANMRSEHGGADREFGVRVVGLQTDITGDYRRPLLVLMGAVAFVLLIVCANTGNLLLARSLARRKEFAIRLALGASRRRIFAHVIAESIVLAVGGGVAGALLAFATIKATVIMAPHDLPMLDAVRLDYRALAFTALLSLMTRVVFGLAPAWQVVRGYAIGVPRTRNKLQRTLAVAQIALSMVLLVGAGLLIRSFILLQNVDLGFRPERLLTLQVYRDLPKSIRSASEYDQWSGFYQRLIARIQTLPGVEAAAATLVLPLTDHRYLVRLNDSTVAEKRIVSTNYFQVMGIPLRRGRFFSDGDGRDAPRVIIINEALARRCFPNEDPIGRSLNRARIIGVVAGVRQGGISEDPFPQIYDPYTQRSLPWMTLVVRTRIDPAAIVSAVRRETAALDPTQPIGRVVTMEELVESSLQQPRFRTTLLGIYAAVALFLALVGIYGVLAYSVTSRVREMGIRMAVGARRGDIQLLVIREALYMIGAGLAVGIAGALALSRVLAGFVFGVGSTDPFVFIAAPILFAAAALVASSIPANRASRLDPISVLRHLE